MERPDDPVEFIYHHFEDLHHKQNSSKNKANNNSKQEKSSKSTKNLQENSSSILPSSVPFKLETNSEHERTVSNESEMSDGSSTVKAGNRHVAGNRRRGAVSAEVYTEEDAKNYEKVIMPRNEK